MRHVYNPDQSNLLVFSQFWVKELPGLVFAAIRVMIATSGTIQQWTTLFKTGDRVRSEIEAP
jgi:hypothetical protein